MPKVNVYVPDDLLTAVRAADIQVSAICQEALQNEVRRLAVTAAAGEDLQAVAARLLAGQKTADRRAHEDGLELGATWARRAATLAELDRVDRVVDRGWQIQLERIPSLVTLLLDVNPEGDHRPDDWLDGDASRFERGVLAGAAQVYREVRPLLNGGPRKKKGRRRD